MVKSIRTFALALLLLLPACSGRYLPPPHTIPESTKYAGLSFQECGDTIAIYQIDKKIRHGVLDVLMKKRGYVPAGVTTISQEGKPSRYFLEKDGQTVGACMILYSIENAYSKKRLTKGYDSIKSGSYYSPPNNGRIISKERIGKDQKYELITYEYIKEYITYDLRISFWKQIADFDPVKNPKHRLDALDEDLLEKEIARQKSILTNLKKELKTTENKIRKSKSQQQVIDATQEKNRNLAKQEVALKTIHTLETGDEKLLIIRD